jgi:N-acetyl-alpha-D-muramate 1-phosphate uridylyltransferase
VIEVRRAMVQAAGLGLRLRPLTETTPKPLIEVAGRTLLDRALDRFAGLELVVVNAHHLADQVAAHLEGRKAPATYLSREEILLDTGGGTRAALDRLGNGPFFVSSSDILITRGPAGDELDRLRAVWDDARMDALILVQPREAAHGFVFAGDFDLDAEARPIRRGSAPAADYVYASTQLVHPRLFEGAPAAAFSFNLLWDKAIAAGRLFAVVHDGGWCTVDTPRNLAAAPGWLARHGG